MNRPPDTKTLAKRAAKLRIILLDVDGVLTDGGIILFGEDGEAKRFDVKDGMGITLAKLAGIEVGIVTSRYSEVVRRRASELGIEHVYQGARQKSETLDIVLENLGLDPSQVAFIGDDIQDIPIMRRVGFPVAVQDAMPEVKKHSVYVTEAQGGHGAVREAIEWMLQLRGDREKVYQSVTGETS